MQESACYFLTLYILIPLGYLTTYMPQYLISLNGLETNFMVVLYANLNTNMRFSFKGYNFESVSGEAT